VVSSLDIYQTQQGKYSPLPCLADLDPLTIMTQRHPSCFEGLLDLFLSILVIRIVNVPIAGSLRLMAEEAFVDSRHALGPLKLSWKV
jgi:hypothetical protein